MLVQAESERLKYWEHYLPDEIKANFKTKKHETKTKQEKKEELRLDKPDKLESYLNAQKLDFDEMYGTKTVESNRCLLCGVRPISIVVFAHQIFMNCGHAVACEACMEQVPAACSICGVEISYLIKANKEDRGEPLLRKGSSREVLRCYSELRREASRSQTRL